MSIRIERINSEIQKGLAEIIRGLRDVRITEIISVMNVETASDLKTAKVYISVFGDKQKCDATFEALLGSAGYIRREMARMFRTLKTVPELVFVRDNSQEYADKINKLLEGLK